MELVRCIVMPHINRVNHDKTILTCSPWRTEVPEGTAYPPRRRGYGTRYRRIRPPLALRWACATGAWEL